MIDDEISSWLDKLRKKLARDGILFIHLGNVYPKSRQAILDLTNSVYSVQEYFGSNVERSEIHIISDIETLVKSRSSDFGRLRERVFHFLDEGCQVVLLSGAPRAAFPSVPGSSLIHETKIYMPPLHDEGFGIEAAELGISLKSLIRRTMTELGEATCASLESALFDDPGQNALSAIRDDELESLMTSGLVVRADGRARWSNLITSSDLREVLSDVISALLLPQDLLFKVANDVWIIERRVRQALRARAKRLWGAKWSSELIDYAGFCESVVMKAQSHVVPDAKSLSDLRDPLEWLSLEQVLRVREHPEIGNLGLADQYWRKFEFEFVPIKDRVERSQLIRKSDPDVTGRWESKLSNCLSTSGSEDPDVVIRSLPDSQASVLKSLRASLTENTLFKGDLEKDFMALIGATLRFLINVYDTGPSFTRPFSDRREAPAESDLQAAYRAFLDGVILAGLVTCEVSTIASGRADVVVNFDAGRRFVTEVKREFDKTDQISLEGKYLEQALSYQNTNAPFSHLLVLDLSSPRPAHLEHIEKSMWITHRRDEYGDIVSSTLISVVRANRAVPSARK